MEKVLNAHLTVPASVYLTSSVTKLRLETAVSAARLLNEIAPQKIQFGSKNG